MAYSIRCRNEISTHSEYKHSLTFRVRYIYGLVKTYSKKRVCIYLKKKKKKFIDILHQGLDWYNKRQKLNMYKFHKRQNVSLSNPAESFVSNLTTRSQRRAVIVDK